MTLSGKEHQQGINKECWQTKLNCTRAPVQSLEFLRHPHFGQRPCDRPASSAAFVAAACKSAAKMAAALELAKLTFLRLTAGAPISPRSCCIFFQVRCAVSRGLRFLVSAIGQLDDHAVDLAHVSAGVLVACCRPKPRALPCTDIVIQRAHRRGTSKMLLLGLVEVASRLGQCSLVRVMVLFGSSERCGPAQPFPPSPHFISQRCALSAQFFDHRRRMPERFTTGRKRIPRGKKKESKGKKRVRAKVKKVRVKRRVKRSKTSRIKE